MKLDHIAVAGLTLEEAVLHVETALGVSMQVGGKHDVFGTHNCLLGLGHGIYLEAIAIDPDAPKPSRARWFDLDRFSGAARLSNWICETPGMIAALEHFGTDAGKPVELSRGDFRWTMAVPPDGRLPYDNMFPALIEWHCPIHPSQVLQDAGCRLHRLIVSHPEAHALDRMLSTCFADQRVVFDTGPVGLRAEISTPHGLRQLS